VGARGGPGHARVGITDYAQDALGDVVYVDVPDVGTVVTAGQPFAEVESTKSVSDVYAPVGGTVIERNQLLEDRPELVNDQPYGDGWRSCSRSPRRRRTLGRRRLSGIRGRGLGLDSRPGPELYRRTHLSSASLHG
jgi:glycine cleavage system H protein